MEFINDAQNETNNNGVTWKEIGNYFNNFPVGYVFDPTDDELIMSYLIPKINRQPLPINLMHDVNIYHHNPDRLAVEYPSQGSKNWYFFTPRDKKYPKGQRPNRAAGGGYWKATGADKVIKRGSAKVGYRKALVYHKGRPPRGEKTLWIMHEFRVTGPSHVRQREVNSMRLDDFVLCRIYKKKEGTGRNKGQAQPEEEEEEAVKDEIIEENPEAVVKDGSTVEEPENPSPQPEISSMETLPPPCHADNIDNPDLDYGNNWTIQETNFISDQQDISLKQSKANMEIPDYPDLDTTSSMGSQGSRCLMIDDRPVYFSEDCAEAYELLNKFVTPATGDGVDMRFSENAYETHFPPSR